jgi:hypothetical protein
MRENLELAALHIINGDKGAALIELRKALGVASREKSKARGKILSAMNYARRIAA